MTTSIITVFIPTTTVVERCLTSIFEGPTVPSDPCRRITQERDPLMMARTKTLTLALSLGGHPLMHRDKG